MKRAPVQRINPLVNSGRTSVIAQRVANHVYVAMARSTLLTEEGLIAPLLLESGEFLLLESGEPLGLE